MNWINHALTWWISGIAGIALYWVPVAACLIGYTIRSWRHIQKDQKSRSRDDYYVPGITVGNLIGWFILSWIPIANLMATVFDLAPHFFERFFKAIGRIFDQPLIADSDHYKQERKQRKNNDA